MRQEQFTCNKRSFYILKENGSAAILFEFQW